MIQFHFVTITFIKLLAIVNNLFRSKEFEPNYDHLDEAQRRKEKNDIETAYDLY